MANYRQHLAGGVVLGVIGAIGAFLSAGLTLIQSTTVFILTVFAALSPDIDSDTSRPVEILFGIGGIIMPILSIHYFLHDSYSIETLLCFILFSYLIIRYIISNIFFRITKHRGIIHSIPMAVIFAEVGFLIFSDAKITNRFIYAGALFCGYLLHLTMDEIWSVDILGVRIKKSFGSALTFKDESKLATLFVYAVIVILGLVITGIVSSAD